RDEDAGQARRQLSKGSVLRLRRSRREYRRSSLTAVARRATVDRMRGEETMSLSQPIADATTKQAVEIVPLTLHIGAEIRGVDLTKPLPPNQVKQVRDAFLKWKVVFFRNQHLDHAQHVAM